MSKRPVKIVQETRWINDREYKALLPVYATAGAKAADVHAFCPGIRLIVKPDEVSMVPTGLYFEIPDDTGLFILPRSGIGRRKITIPNAPGLLDVDYRGQLMVLLHNETAEDFIVNHDDRIAQIALVPFLTMAFESVQELSSTDRGAGGFGSTGVEKL